MTQVQRLPVFIAAMVCIVLSLCRTDGTAERNATPQAKSNSVTVTYIGNEGVLISSGEHQVLIDGLHREYKPDYAFPSPALLTALETAHEPYNKIDLILVSHVHLDHFHGQSIGLHLKNNKSAQLISSEQIVSGVKEKSANFAEISGQVRQVTPEWKSLSTIELEGINLKILGLHHSGANFSWVQNLGHVIEIGGRKFLHIGDADMTAENFSSFNLSKEDIDVAFIPYWFLLSDNGRAFVRDQFRPKQIVAVHVPPAEAEKITSDFAKSNPGTIVFSKILETKNF